MLTAQRSRSSVLLPTDKKTIASVLTWDLQREVHPDEVEMIYIQHDIVWVNLANHQAVPIHKETFRNILRQQQELAEKHDREQHNIEPHAQLGDFEIDRGHDGLYRVWKGTELLGSFYRCQKTDKWVAQPRFSGAIRRYKTAKQAQDAITRPYQTTAPVRTTNLLQGELQTTFLEPISCR